MPESKPDPIVVLADAVNQLAIVVEALNHYTVQHGYTDVTYPQRRQRKEDLRKIREDIADLIPE